MKKRMFVFECPHCGHSFYMVRDTYLIADERSPETLRLNEGTFFDHCCQNCHHLFPLEYPLIFRDSQKGYSLILSTSPVQGISGKAVLVKNTIQFKKAYSILRFGLSLEPVLRIMKMMENKHNAPCFLVDWDGNHLWVQCGRTLTAVEYEKGNLPLNTVQ